MNSKVVKLKSFETHRLEVVAGHLKDAWLHVMAEKPLPGGVRYTPTDDIFKEIAQYLEGAHVLDEAPASHYHALYNAVSSSMKVQDADGIAFRDYRGPVSGPVAEIREHLLDAFSHTQSKQPEEPHD